MGLMAASCAGEEPDEPRRGSAMEFAAGTEGQQSRANSGGLSQFAVFGDIKPVGSTGTESVTEIMRNIVVTYKTDKWEYEGTQYWFPKNEHSFAAIHPASVLTNDANASYSKSRLTFTYTLPQDYTTTTDILAATHRRQYDEGEADVVTLKFGHVLTQINISPALDDNKMGQDGYIEVTKIEFSGIKNKAEINVTPAPIQSVTDRTDDMTLELKHVGESTLAIEFQTPKRVNNNEASVSLFGSNDTPMMLPQIFEANSEAQILITYTISSEPKSEKQLSIPLKGYEWISAKSYDYKFTLTRSGLTLGTCEIQPWNVVEGEHITVD